MSSKKFLTTMGVFGSIFLLIGITGILSVMNLNDLSQISPFVIVWIVFTVLGGIMVSIKILN